MTPSLWSPELATWTLATQAISGRAVSRGPFPSGEPAPHSKGLRLSAVHKPGIWPAPRGSVPSADNRPVNPY